MDWNFEINYTTGLGFRKGHGTVEQIQRCRQNKYIHRSQVIVLCYVLVLDDEKINVE